MKANELMVGNWVLHNGKPARIEEIGGMACLKVDGKTTFASLGEIKPIPLTPEILEKNGFVEHRDGLYATEQEQLAGDGFVVRNMVYYKSGILSVVTERGEIWIGIKFIHELQRALRLCGIEKQIIL